MTATAASRELVCLTSIASRGLAARPGDIARFPAADADRLVARGMAREVTESDRKIAELDRKARTIASATNQNHARAQRALNQRGRAAAGK